MNSIPTKHLTALRELTLHFVRATTDWRSLGRDADTPVENAFSPKDGAELLLGPDVLGVGLALWSTGNFVCIVKLLDDGSLGFRALL